MIQKILLIALIALLAVAFNAVIFIAGIIVVTWAWNELFSGVFELPRATFTQMLALGILLGLFENFINVVFQRNKEEEE